MEKQEGPGHTFGSPPPHLVKCQVTALLNIFDQIQISVILTSSNLVMDVNLHCKSQFRHIDDYTQTNLVNNSHTCVKTILNGAEGVNFKSIKNLAYRLIYDLHRLQRDTLMSIEFGST